MTSENCPICDSKSRKFETVLTDYPLGNVYLNSHQNSEFYLKNLILSQCKCGHVAAQSLISSDAIYRADYPYLGHSPVPTMRREFGLRFIKSQLPKAFGDIVDIGCGNFELLLLFGSKLKTTGIKIGVDPVPRDNPDPQVTFFNCYFEHTDLRLGLGRYPNLICMDNVLEHVNNLDVFLSRLTKCIRRGEIGRAHV